MAEYTIDKIEYNSNVYKLQDNVSGYITGISSSDVTTALGYTPLSSSSTLDATKLSGTIPAGCYTDTDTKMTQTYAAESGYSYWRPLIIGYSSGSTEGFTPSTVTNTAYAFKSLTVQPSTGTIRVGNVSLYKGSYTTKFSPDTLTANRTITVPNKTGTLALTSDIPDVSGFITTDTNTTYTLTNALSSHKFTWTLTAGGSGSGSTTTTAELVAGAGITLTDDTTNKKITIASSITNTDEKLSVAAVTSGSTYYPIVGSGTSAATRQIDSTGFLYSGTDGTANSSTDGKAFLTLGNSTNYTTAGWKRGMIRLYSCRSGYTDIRAYSYHNYSNTVDLPTSSGTLALQNEIIYPSVIWIYGNDDGSGNITYEGPTYYDIMGQIQSAEYCIRCYYTTSIPDPEDEYNVIYSGDYSIYYLSYYDENYEDDIVFINTTYNNGNLIYSIITIDNNDNIAISTAASGGGGSSVEIIRWTED